MDIAFYIAMVLAGIFLAAAVLIHHKNRNDEVDKSN